MIEQHVDDLARGPPLRLRMEVREDSVPEDRMRQRSEFVTGSQASRYERVTKSITPSATVASGFSEMFQDISLCS